jgi:mono/diheme cytochrome c family protein
MSRLALSAALALALAGPAAASGPPWAQSSPPPSNPTTPAERGAVVFQGRCEICHGTGRDRAGTISLGFKYGRDKPALLTERTDLTPAAVKFYVRNGSAMMPFFRKTELSDAELSDLAAYLSRKKR